MSPADREADCGVDGCGSRAFARGWCRPHYDRWRRRGDPLAPPRERRSTRRAAGYVAVYRPSHPLAEASGYVAEHRMVAWDAGLFTDATWDVHHINGDRYDNRVENLRPMPRAAHAREHNAAAEWQRAKTHCPAGHPYSEENTARVSRGDRVCKTCKRERDRARGRSTSHAA